MRNIIRSCKRVILHLGTNNILSDTMADITDKFTNLISEIKAINSDCRIFISSITARNDVDDIQIDVHEVNEALKVLCASLRLSFINNRNA